MSGRSPESDPDAHRASGLLDRLTGVDEQLDRTNDLLERQATLLERLATPPPADGDGGGRVAASPVEAFPVEFSVLVPADTGRDNPTTVTRTMPADVRITTVILGWRDGADGQVGIQFGTESGERFVPRNSEDQYLAFNDFSHPFTVRTEVSEGTTLRAQMVNLDTTNDHQANAVAELEFLDNPLGGPGGPP